MTYVSDLPLQRDGLAGTLSQLRQSLGRGLAPQPHPPAPLAPTGAASAALIDADFERMAGFGSWAALRRDLRAQAGVTDRGD